jgi:predicted DNA-binding antitoxin AbrB/MazE fold protein
MPDEEIDAVFENGVFRPLQPVRLPEHLRVTLILPATQGRRGSRDSIRRGRHARGL